MTLYLARHSITSSVVDECAERLPGRAEPAWRLSWRQTPLLDREQAMAAMDLTEILASRPAAANPAWQRARSLAAALDIDLHEAEETLRRRRRERGEP